jgi:hypothetical protein
MGVQKTSAAIGGLGLPPSTGDYLAVLYFIATLAR